MGKIVFWIVIVFAVLLVLRMIGVAKARRDRETAKPRESDPPPSGPMVRCADCGVFLPKADALPSPRGFGCGDPRCAHRGGASR
jgi:uncharacterized protein